MATTCQTYPLNPGDTDLADVAEPHAARASDISKVDAPASARNQSRCRMGRTTPCRRNNPFITIRRCGPSPGSTIPPGWSGVNGCADLPIRAVCGGGAVGVEDE